MIKYIDLLLLSTLVVTNLYALNWMKVVLVIFLKQYLI